MFGGSFAVNTSDLLPSLADNVLVCLLFFFPFRWKKTISISLRWFTKKVNEILGYNTRSRDGQFQGSRD